MGACTGKAKRDLQSQTYEPVSGLSTPLASPKIEQQQHQQTTILNYYPLSVNVADKYVQKGKNKRGEMELFHKLFSETRVISTIDKPKQSREDVEKLQMQLSRWLILYHPNIQNHYDIYDNNGQFCILKERVKGKNLYEFLGAVKHSEVKFRHLMQKIFLAVHAMHQNNLIHNEICGESFIFSKLERKSKFRILTLFDKTEDVIQYRSPESLRNQPTQKSDIWSLGVLLYFGLSGELPFRGSSMKKTQELILQGSVNVQTDGFRQVSEEAVQLIKKMLSPDKRRRPSILECLGDRWFSKPKQILNKSHKERLGESLNNFKLLKVPSVMQQLSLYLIFQIYISKKKIRKYYALFRRLDTDYSGKITKLKLQRAVEQIIPKSEAIDKVNQIFHNFDFFKRGYFDIHQFLVLFGMELEHLNLDKYARVFSEIDFDNNGYISVKEMQAQLAKLNYSDSALNQVFIECDLDQDGFISRKDFMVAVKSMVIADEQIQANQDLQQDQIQSNQDIQIQI